MELRWILLGFGVLLLLTIYLWGKGIVPLKRTGPDSLRRREPVVDDRGENSVTTTADDTAPVAKVRRPPKPPDKVVALRIIARGEELPSGEHIVLALRGAGMEYGSYGIFHRFVDGDVNSPLFSVARLTQPGTFDLTKLTEVRIPGLSIFMTLPGKADPVERFDSMLETARILARELNAEIFDEKGSSWSVQRERYLREEIIEYRHQHQRSPIA